MGSLVGSDEGGRAKLRRLIEKLCAIAKIFEERKAGSLEEELA